MLELLVAEETYRLHIKWKRLPSGTQEDHSVRRYRYYQGGANGGDTGNDGHGNRQELQNNQQLQSNLRYDASEHRRYTVELT